MGTWQAQRSGLERRSGLLHWWGLRTLRLLDAVRGRRGRRLRKVQQVLGGRGFVHEEATPSQAVQTSGEGMSCPSLGGNPVD